MSRSSSPAIQGSRRSVPRSCGGPRRLVWIDDQPRTVSRHVGKLQKRGWQVELYRPDEDYLQPVRDSDAVLLDLRWSPPRRRHTSSTKPHPSSRVMAQILAASEPQKPLLFISNWFADASYANIEREISPAAITDRVEKTGAASHSASNDLSNEVVEEIDSKLERLLELSAESTEQSEFAGITAPEDELAEVFGVSPGKYDSMSAEARLKLAQHASELVRELVEWNFDNSNASWLLVGGLPPRVLLWGRHQDKLTDADIDNVAVDYGVVPFYYARPQNIL